MNELVESIVNFIIGVIAPFVFGGYILIKVFSAISGWLTEEKDSVLGQLEASGANELAQILLETKPGRIVSGTVWGISVQVRVCSIIDGTNTPSTETSGMVIDYQGRVEIRLGHTEGVLMFLVGASSEDMQLVRDHLTRALITVREEWVRNPPENQGGEGQEPYSSPVSTSPAHE